MKKITLILAAFILIIGVQSYAQEVIPAERSTDHIELDDKVKDGKSLKKVKRNRAYKRAHKHKRAHKRQIQAMRRVARADGVVSPQEKAVIKKERRKIARQSKRAMKRREVKRKQRMGESPGTFEGRG